MVALARRTSGLRTASSLSLLAAIMFAPLCAANAQAARVTGGWDLSLSDTNRRCHITLRDDKGERDTNLGLPAICKRALPILSGVDNWRQNGRDVELTGRDGVVLAFAAQSADMLVATGPEGETYNLALARDDAAPPARLVAAPVDENDLTAAVRPRTTPGMVVAQAQPGGFRPVELQSPAIQPAQQPPRSIAQQTPRRPAAATPTQPAGPALRPGELAGRYAILRENNKDTGCMLTLDDKGRGPGGTMRAILAPACRDQGIVIFDPLGWTVDRGRLSLLARKGHRAHFEMQPDGTLQKDPKEGGKALGFRKL